MQKWAFSYTHRWKLVQIFWKKLDSIRKSKRFPSFNPIIPLIKIYPWEIVMDIWKYLSLALLLFAVTNLPYKSLSYNNRKFSYKNYIMEIQWNTIQVFNFGGYLKEDCFTDVPYMKKVENIQDFIKPWYWKMTFIMIIFQLCGECSYHAVKKI